MAQWLKDLYHRGKDATASGVLEKVLRDRLSPYGRVSSFALDSRRKTIHLELVLHGEQAPLAINIEEFEIVDELERTSFVIRRATASREWIQRLMDDFVIGKAWPIPEKYASMAKLIVK